MEDAQATRAANQERPPGDRLESWKEIAAYLKRDTTTVQRWEKREGMPVHRHVHDKSSSISASRSELDAWARSRNLRAADPVATPSVEDSTPEEVVELPRRRVALVLVFVLAAATAAAGYWALNGSDYFWKSPVEGAAVRVVADLDGTADAAAISPDGRFVAFLSERDGPMDVWISQLGTGQFHNLTRGRVQDLVNPSVRSLAFSADGSLVTCWTRRRTGTGAAGEIGIWAVPALGGEPRPYLEGAAEVDWAKEGGGIVYHTAGPGDPTYIRAPGQPDRLLFAAPAGQHAHFPTWAPGGSFIYFVRGAVPAAMDIWRIRASGGNAERLTTHNSRVSHPVLLDRRTLLYLATGGDGGGPWLHAIDVDRRVVHRLSSPLEKYTSLSASADGRRLVATLSRPKETLWRLPLSQVPATVSGARRVPLTTARGFSPRFGPGYLVYVSSTEGGDAIWRVAGDSAAELWSAAGARLIGGPAVAPDGVRVAFSVEQDGRRRLVAVNADGTKARVVTDALDLRSAPAWSPDGGSLTVSANEAGVPRLFTVPLAGGRPARVSSEYALDPAWSPDGAFVAYSGPDIGTAFDVKAVRANASAYLLPELTLNRGSRPLRFYQGRRALVVLRGDIGHKNLWLVDLETGAWRQLTDLPADFHVRDFDISPDGREVVLDRVQEDSDIVLLERPGR